MLGLQSVFAEALPAMNEFPYVFVDSQDGLERAASALASCSRLYLDTEFESGRGSTRLCLLQSPRRPKENAADLSIRGARKSTNCLLRQNVEGKRIERCVPRRAARPLTIDQSR